MGDLIDDDLLGAFAVVGPPDEVPGLLRERLDGVVDRLSFYAPYEADPGIWIPMLRQMRSG
jgi:hypothetical protein